MQQQPILSFVISRTQHTVPRNYSDNEFQFKDFEALRAIVANACKHCFVGGFGWLVVSIADATPHHNRARCNPFR